MPPSAGPGSDRLSLEESTLVLAIVRRWMHRLRIRSIYGLFVLGDVSRSTLYRWMAGERAVRLPIRSVRGIARALAREAESSEPVVEVGRVLDLAVDRIRAEKLLVAEFRARRLSFQKVISAIHAAKHRIVPEDEAL